MTCVRPLLLILAFCLAFTAPAQAGGWLDAGTHTCRHLTAGAAAAQATAPDGVAQDGIIGAACHAMFAIVEAGACGISNDGATKPPIVERRLDLSLRLSGIDRPPKT
jgi:hypothetical protein